MLSDCASRSHTTTKSTRPSQRRRDTATTPGHPAARGRHRTLLLHAYAGSPWSLCPQRTVRWDCPTTHDEKSARQEPNGKETNNSPRTQLTREAPPQCRLVPRRCGFEQHTRAGDNRVRRTPLYTSQCSIDLARRSASSDPSSTILFPVPAARQVT